MRAIIGKLLLSIRRMNNWFIKGYQLSKFQIKGQGIYIGDYCHFTEKNIQIGDDVYIGRNCIFQSSYGKIIIGNHVMFGPGVHVHGGNHKFNEKGTLMKHASPKKQGDDGEVVISDDCWIGANAIILSNVKIGKGCVIGAGSIVTHSLPDYTIYTGVPSLKIRNRF